MPTCHRPPPRFAMLALLSLLVACQAPPDKPTVSRNSPARSAPPVPRAVDPAAGLPTSGAGGGATPGGRGEGYGAVVPNAAVVVEEEVATDGSVRSVQTSGEAAPPGSRGPREGGPGRQGGGGGGDVPPAKYALPNKQAGGGGGRAAAPTGERSGELGGRIDTGARGAHLDDAVTAPAAEDVARARREAAERLGVESGLEEGHGQRLDRGDGGRGAGGGAARSTGLGETPDETGATRGNFRARATPPSPRPPAPVQDDVLAQQLRAAAEKEQDPTLRAKLWAEYQRYKAGLGTTP